MQLRGVLLSKLLLCRFTELQHGTCAALEAHCCQQCRAVCKQAGGCGGLVFLRERFVPLFKDDRMTDEDGRKQQKQQHRNKDDPECRLVEKPCPLTAVRGVVLRIVRLCVVLLQLLTFRYAGAIAVSFLARADRLDAALGLLGGEIFKARRQRQRQPAHAILIDLDPCARGACVYILRFTFCGLDRIALDIAGRDAVIAEGQGRDGRVLVRRAVRRVSQRQCDIAASIKAQFQKRQRRRLRLLFRQAACCTVAFAAAIQHRAELRAELCGHVQRVGIHELAVCAFHL